MRSEPPELVAAVVLAAGSATRFGGPKLLMPFGESTVVGCVVQALSCAGVEALKVVVGPDAPLLARALSGRGICLVRNPAPERGMFSSVRLGVSALPPGVSRFFVALGDQPRVGSADIRRLLEAHESSGKGIVVPVNQGRRGHPVLLSRRYRDVILGWSDRGTLRDVIRDNEGDLAEVVFESDAVTEDIDTKEDYDHARRRAPRGG